MSNISRYNNHVQAVDRALALLKLIAEQSEPVPLSHLCEATGLNRTTVWRLLCTLEDNGFVEKNAAAPDYELGIAALNLFQRRHRAICPADPAFSSRHAGADRLLSGVRPAVRQPLFRDLRH